MTATAIKRVTATGTAPAAMATEGAIATAMATAAIVRATATGMESATAMQRPWQQWWQ